MSARDGWDPLLPACVGLHKIPFSIVEEHGLGAKRMGPDPYSSRELREGVQAVEPKLAESGIISVPY